MFGGFNSKGFTSLTLALGSIGMVVSGIVLYLSPRGRVANWTGWSFMGVEKETWGTLHTTMALLIIVVAGIHLYLNWRTFFSYLRVPAVAGLNLKREAAAALILTGVVTAGSLYNLPPFSVVPSLGQRMKDSWETQASGVPYPHAELSSLSEFAERTGVSVDVIMSKLNAKGVKVTSADQKIADIAAANGLAPQSLFADSLASSAPRAYGAGSGMGRKTLQEICSEEGLAVDVALKNLAQAGVTAQPDDSLRTIAEGAGMNPHELLGLLKDGGKATP